MKILSVANNAACVALLVLASRLASGQTSAFQSGTGQTSVYLAEGAAATINVADTKFSIGRVQRNTARRFYYGYEVFGAASSGVTTLFSSKIKVPEGGGDLVIGVHPFLYSPTGTNQDDWLLLDVGYSRSSFYVSSEPEPIDKAKRYFDRFRTIVAYNNLATNWFLFGIAAGAERRNNLDDLKQVSFETSVVSAAQSGAANIVQTKSGFFGNYGEYIAAPIYTDLLFVLPKTVPGFKSQIAIDGFTRSDVAAPHRSADGGIGVFLTTPKAPTKVLGGLAASWNDGKVRVALVASYNF